MGGGATRLGGDATAGQSLNLLALFFDLSVRTSIVELHPSTLCPLSYNCSACHERGRPIRRVERSR